MNFSLADFRNKLQISMGVIQTSKVTQAISGGMMLLLPVMMVGKWLFGMLSS